MLVVYEGTVWKVTKTSMFQAPMFPVKGYHLKCGDMRNMAHASDCAEITVSEMKRACKEFKKG